MHVINETRVPNWYTICPSVTTTVLGAGFSNRLSYWTVFNNQINITWWIRYKTRIGKLFDSSRAVIQECHIYLAIYLVRYIMPLCIVTKLHKDEMKTDWLRADITILVYFNKRMGGHIVERTNEWMSKWRTNEWMSKWRTNEWMNE